MVIETGKQDGLIPASDPGARFLNAHRMSRFTWLALGFLTLRVVCLVLSFQGVDISPRFVLRFLTFVSGPIAFVCGLIAVLRPGEPRWPAVLVMIVSPLITLGLILHALFTYFR